MSDERIELQAPSVRAADQEFRRQDAREHGDRQAEQAAEQELSRIWGRYCELERRVA